MKINKIYWLIGVIIILIIGIFVVQNISKEANIKTDKFPLSVGDKIGNMIIVKIEKYMENSELSLEQNLKVTLSGSIIVGGTYDPGGMNPDVPWWDDRTGIFELDDNSISLLPNLPKPWSRGPGNGVCFNNFEFARKKLGLEKKDITLKLDNFVLNYYPSDVFDGADFIEEVK